MMRTLVFALVVAATVAIAAGALASPAAADGVDVERNVTDPGALEDLLSIPGVQTSDGVLVGGTTDVLDDATAWTTVSGDPTLSSSEVAVGQSSLAFGDGDAATRPVPGADAAWSVQLYHATDDGTFPDETVTLDLRAADGDRVAAIRHPSSGVGSWQAYNGTGWEPVGQLGAGTWAEVWLEIGDGDVTWYLGDETTNATVSRADADPITTLEVGLDDPDGDAATLYVDDLESGAGTPIPGVPAGDVTLYDEGTGEDDWIEGYVEEPGDVTLSKESDHLAIGTNNIQAEGTWVTAETVDLTGVDTVTVDWSDTGLALGGAEVTIAASTDQTGDHDVADASLTRPPDFARTEDGLDVSGLSGDHYIRVHGDGGGSDIDVYGVTLEATSSPDPTTVLEHDFGADTPGVIAATTGIQTGTAADLIAGDGTMATLTGDSETVIDDTDGLAAANATLSIDATPDDATAALEITEIRTEFPTDTPALSNPTPNASSGVVDAVPPELSVDVADADFPAAQGDAVDVTFYDASDDSQIGTDTLGANGTATTDWTTMPAGENHWYAEATDDYGNVATSDTATIQSPDELAIRNVTSQALVDDVDVTVEFYPGGETITEETTSDGTIDLAGLPANQSIVVSAAADGYRGRTTVIESILSQQTAWLLPDDATASQILFQLDDYSGQFTGNGARLLIERAINDTYERIAGDDFGAAGEIPVWLADETRYRLVLENADGLRRTLGAYTTADTGITVLEVGEIEWTKDEQLYRWSASYHTDAADQWINIVYEDADGRTSDLEWTVHEQGDPSAVLDEGTEFGTVTSFTAAVDVPDDRANETWVVSFDADREGHSPINASTVVGATPSIAPPFTGAWLPVVAGSLLFAVGLLFGGLLGSLGAVVVAATAMLLQAMGWLPVPGSVVLGALVVALTWAIAAYGGGR